MCINPPSAVAQCTDLLLSQSGPGQNRCEPGGRYDLHILYGHLAAEVQELEGVFNDLLAVHLAKGIDVSVIPGVRL